MTGLHLDNRAARRLFLHRHGLGDAPTGSGKGPDLLDVIERLGFVQLDSVMTVARAHDMILRARRTSYRPAHLKRLYEVDRQLFEHWTHDAAVIPRSYYPHWHLRFARDREMLKARWQKWRGHTFDDQFDTVLSHIRDNGPVSSAEVGPQEGKKSGGWWEWHPSKTALEYLWRTGTLTVIGRDGFQKRYDLTERVIEEHLHGPAARPDPEETIDWCCRTAMDRLGFATSGELAAFWATITPQEAKDWCAAKLASGEIVAATIAGHDGALRKVFAWPDVDQAAAALPPVPGRLRVLSPFDPALRDRNRAQRLFGFHYRIEIFVPAPKRVYGYYVFPLMEGDRLVGRVDMKTDRESAQLVVTALWPENGVRWGGARQARLETELDRVARFAGMEGVTFLDGWMRDPQP
ncbi:winged helix-turn-helix domain-containing protein [Chachezhania sediminis]|uniref:winged helix-turn-helix domain-containing protein n=1 Tax=Chachezhania sediminis TaxID=2599291 RepID=UPI00131DDF6A|nr:crosslink repair DNA glycosylase YcaQ family protein [Chachezhania sediminis]